MFHFAFADLTESPETRHHPFSPGLCVDGNDGLGLDAQTTESGTEAEGWGVHLVVVEPLVVAQVKLLEHLSVLLSLVSLAKNFPEKKLIYLRLGTVFATSSDPHTHVFQCLSCNSLIRLTALKVKFCVSYFWRYLTVYPWVLRAEPTLGMPHMKCIYSKVLFSNDFTLRAGGGSNKAKYLCDHLTYGGLV